MTDEKTLGDGPLFAKKSQKILENCPTAEGPWEFESLKYTESGPMITWNRPMDFSDDNVPAWD